MHSIEHKIDYSKKMLQFVYLNLDQLTFDNFDTLFPKIVQNIGELKKLRAEMLTEYGSERVKKFDPELLEWAKQVEEKFDNIVEVFLLEEKRLEIELASIIGRKKLTAYKR